MPFNFQPTISSAKVQYNWPCKDSRSSSHNTATLNRGKEPDLFLQSEPFQNFGLNNLCEILSQNLRKSGKKNW